MSAKSAGSDFSGSEFSGDGPLVPTGPPQTLRWNIWVTAVWCGLTIVSNLILFGERGYERKVLTDANNRDKNPVPNYTGAKLDHDVHTRLISGLIVSVLVSVILVLLAVLTSRGRRWARWVLLAMAIVGLPLGVGVIEQLVVGTVISAPALYRLTVILAGFTSLLVAVLLLHRETRIYFAAVRATERGTLPAVPGARAARPGGGLAALFAARRQGAASRARSASVGTQSTTDEPSSGADASADARDGENGTAQTPAVGPAGGTGPAGRPKAKGGGPRPGRSKSRQRN
jgi:hypothetical protein